LSIGVRERESESESYGDNGRESTEPRGEGGVASGGSVGRSGATAES